MKTFISRITGLILIIGAIFGLALSVSGIMAVWAAKPEVEDQLTKGIAILNNTLEATDNLLVIANDSLKQSASSLDAIKTISEDTSKVLDTTAPVLNSVGSIVGENFSTVITNVKSSLTSIGSTAKLIDGTLKIISSIPLIGANYKPEIPISDSINNIINEVDPLPDKFAQIEKDLKTTSQSLSSLKSDIDNLKTNIDALNKDITAAENVIDAYQLIIKQLKETISVLQDQLMTYINLAAWGITMLLAWMVIAQIGLFTQGLGLMKSRDTKINREDTLKLKP